MGLVKSMLLAGTAVAGLGLLAPVLAGEVGLHRLTVQLPDGGVETIQYSGHVLPRLIVHRAPDYWALARADWSPVPVFASPSFWVIDRAMADMDRQMAVMIRQAGLLTRLPQGPALNPALLHGLPPGTTSFSLVQTSTGSGVCTRVTRIMQGAQDVRPQIVSQTSGCGDNLQEKPPANPDLKQIAYPVPTVPAARSHL